jgi:hypothetical protein
MLIIRPICTGLITLDKCLVSRAMIKNGADDILIFFLGYDLAHTQHAISVSSSLVFLLLILCLGAQKWFCSRFSRLHHPGFLVFVFRFRFTPE